MEQVQAGDVATWTTVVVGVVSVVAAFVGLIRMRKRRKIPDAAVRDLLNVLLTDFEDIVAAGGRPTSWFTDTERQQRQAKLASLNGAIVDDELNDAVGAVRLAYHDCWTCSSPSRPVGQVERQLMAAHAGQTAVRKAIERFNALSRKYGHL